MIAAIRKMIPASLLILSAASLLTFPATASAGKREPQAVNASAGKRVPQGVNASAGKRVPQIVKTSAGKKAPQGSKASAGKEEPEVNYEYDLEAIHVGCRHQWTPFADCEGLEVSYTSSSPETLAIDPDGTLNALQEGDALICASTPGNEKYKASSYEIFIYVLPGEDGLYLRDTTHHFFYQGKMYLPGELPLETERKLCLTQPDLKVYLEDYLEPWQEKIEDPTQAALNAILNYGAEYFSKNSVFDGYVSSVEAGKTDWMVLLERKEGMCSYNASYFCYLMYLAGLPCMQMDNAESDERGHSWNLIEHDGYFYNLEEYHFLHEPKPRYAAPPLSEATAAYFPGHIIGEYAVHFPVEGNPLTPDLKVGDMGRDLSKACPVLMYEKTSDGTYRAWFDTLEKGNIPAYSDGTVLQPEDLVYRNMETDGDDNQKNETAAALFRKADEMLQDEIQEVW